jgi:hypothetical protein
MPSPNRKQLNMKLAPEDAVLIAEMAALAKRNGRDLVDEIVHAMRRHLAQPPVLRIEEPPLDQDEVIPVPKKRGRPRKAAAEAPASEGEPSAGQQDQDAADAKPASGKGRRKKE